MSIYKTIDRYKELVSALEEQVEFYKNAAIDAEVDEWVEVIPEREELLIRVKIEQLKKELVF